MVWVFLATFAQLLNAIVAFLDKYLLTNEQALPRPFVYAFYTCILTGFWVVIYLIGFIPGISGVPSFDGVMWPTTTVTAVSLTAAVSLFFALFSMFKALREAEAINVIPVIGSVSAIASLLLNNVLLNAPLAANYIWGVLVLACGTLLVAKSVPSRGVLLLAIRSGTFFALHYVAMAVLFDITSFDNGFFWSRIFLMGFTGTLLLFPVYYYQITAQTKTTTKKTGALVLLTKLFAGIAAFLVLKATELGDVAVVQALDGIKFVFILILAMIFGYMFPHAIAKNDARPKEIVHRIIYVALLTIGYVILFI